MKATVTHVHLCTLEPEAGVQFDADDETGAPAVKQRSFLLDPPAEMKAQIVAWAQAELDKQLATLPLNIRPGAVTTALMQVRNARQDAEKAKAVELEAKAEALRAEEAKAAAEAAKLAAEQARAAVADEHAAIAAAKAVLDAQAAALRAEIAALEAAKAAAAVEGPR